MGLIDSEYLKANGYAVFQYQKDGKGNEGVLPVNIDDIPTVEQTIMSRLKSGDAVEPLNFVTPIHEANKIYDKAFGRSD